MTRRVLGVSVTPQIIGVAGSDGLIGQKYLAIGGDPRRSGVLPANTLIDIKDYIEMAIFDRKYSRLAIVTREYSINAKSFAEADVYARLAGVVALTAAMYSVRMLEFSSKAVSEMAIGRKGATPGELVAAAAQNNVLIKGQYAAEAYWLMTLAMKGS